MNSKVTKKRVVRRRLKKSPESDIKKPPTPRTSTSSDWFEEQYNSLTGEMWDAIINGEDKK